MLGRLSADQRAVRLYASVCNALNDLGDLGRRILAAADIIEEKQRFRTAADHIVHAHRDSVDTDRIVPVHQERGFKLGPDAVRTGYEHRLFHAVSGQRI